METIKLLKKVMMIFKKTHDGRFLMRRQGEGTEPERTWGDGVMSVYFIMTLDSIHTTYSLCVSNIISAFRTVLKASLQAK